MRKLIKYFLMLLFIAISAISFPQIVYKNTDVSQSIGSVSNGRLKNAYKLPYSGENFRYFSPLSYYILLLDKEARKNGLKVKKVILKIELKDDLFKTKTGKLLKRRGIYFVKKLPEKINKLHDDHYHINFGFLK